MVIVADRVPPNHDNAYAVWLYSSPAHESFLGFVNPAVKRNGILKTAGPLPRRARSYRQLLVTAETIPRPRAPGRIVLEGRLHIK